MTDVILFHHAQGLTEGVRQFAEDLRAAGHRVTVPDLYEGQTFPTVAEGVAHAQEIGFDTVLERGRQAAEGLPEKLVYAGFSLGVMPAQMLAQTRPGANGALLFHGCLPTSEFRDGSWPRSGVPLQIHAMDRDPYFVDEGDLEAARELVGKVHGAKLFLYPGDQHLFADSSLSSYDEAAARLLLQRVLAFLALLGRREPEHVGADLELLEQFLDLQRQTMLAKTAGLDRDAMAQRLPSSTLSLGGLLYHLALVEESWMEVQFLGSELPEPWSEVDFHSDPEWEFRTGGELDPEAVRQRYREACERSRQAVARAGDPDQPSAKPHFDGRPFSLRWVLLHLIEETARHIGHADLLREAIDGSVGE
jgi:dienelactone hydrolase/uncharacterized damage-inducible protein DinB